MEIENLRNESQTVFVELLLRAQMYKEAKLLIQYCRVK